MIEYTVRGTDPPEFHRVFDSFRKEYAMKRKKRMVLLSISAAILIALTAFLLSALTLLLSGCVISRGTNYVLHTEGDGILSIEVFKLGSQNGIKKIEDDREPAAVIPEERFDEFVEEFYKIEDFRDDFVFVPGAVDPPLSLYGFTVKIKYKSGAVEYVSEGIQFYYGANGSCVSGRHSCDEEEWLGFLGKFAELGKDDPSIKPVKPRR